MEQRSRFKLDLNRGLSTAPHQLGGREGYNHPPGHHASEHNQKRSKKIRPTLGKYWALIVAGILLVLLGVLVFFYIDTRNQLDAAKNPEIAGKTEVEQIVNKINTTIQLPADETPTLATVNDIDKLKDQTFFSSAQNGDKVLIYQSTGTAVLYRPSTGKVIYYSPVTSSATPSQ